MITRGLYMSSGRALETVGSFKVRAREGRPLVQIDERKKKEPTDGLRPLSIGSLKGKGCGPPSLYG